MTKSFLSLQTIVMAACLLSFAPAHAQESSKIAFVSTERIFREAAPAKAAQTKLEAEFAKRDRDLQDMAARLKAQSDKLDKDAAVLSDSDRAKRQRDLSDLDKEFQRKQREFREDLNQRRNEELAVVLERTNKVIRQIAEAEKYDIVFQEAVYASKRIDITDKVLKELAK
ncbi:OmpH family outer membrane protein [Herbaspirillum huttiense]|jgi:outer membrane protein|uniref:OmpH family outer membrane protein n=3 Tax=Herbaspirillum huttiense TaxID=863372 RepID=A0AAJ2H610_9BURK|nr:MULTISPECIES: OmpH family outer membrane protein [Herbaspirillum]MBP1313099.1 outer membrane protein [Herbaspirillum sp. 1130]MCO4856657.1 OmpH family outer membrane protein [Herbaspirillum sp. WGmk3]MDR6738335.1 outer membrane protein [Herbaspirillum sp. 1173]MDR9834476.1 OmpH family outer membrane protein [Herbaspirillum huttiense]MDR9846751.1 OmpH family outer membrane protein [Herbaspirillum huttiense SE1]|tara:strand:+ start:3105 stop:3614 length:510 start_codon:yes stop_codon:yes gene_type:complete